MGEKLCCGLSANPTGELTGQSLPVTHPHTPWCPARVCNGAVTRVLSQAKERRFMPAITILSIGRQ